MLSNALSAVTYGKLENVAIATARATPALSHFNYDAMPSLSMLYEVAEPIHCRIIAFLLLIHYFTL